MVIYSIILELVGTLVAQIKNSRYFKINRDNQKQIKKKNMNFYAKPVFDEINLVFEQ